MNLKDELEETGLYGLERDLGINFRDGKLLRVALTHDSYLNEHQGSSLESNERLEFLGDSVVRLAVSEYIYPSVRGNEKDLHNERERFVTRPVLAKISEALGLERYLLLGKGTNADYPGLGGRLRGTRGCDFSRKGISRCGGLRQSNSHWGQSSSRLGDRVACVSNSLKTETCARYIRLPRRIRDTSTSGILETMVLPSLTRAGYSFRKQALVGERLGGGRHRVDVLVGAQGGKQILVSVKWQQVSGTAEQKVPFEIMCLADTIRRSQGRFKRAYLVLGGEGWRLREYFLHGNMHEYLRNCDQVEIISLEGFVAKANQGRL